MLLHVLYKFPIVFYSILKIRARAVYRDRRLGGGDLGRRGRGLRLRRRGGVGDLLRGAYLATGDLLRGDLLRRNGGDRLRRRGNTRGGVRRLGGGDLRTTRRGDDRDLLLLSNSNQSCNITDTHALKHWVS